MLNKQLHGENQITHEHIKNNAGVREFLEDRGIIPEELPAEENLKKVERKMKSDEKKL
jgi:DNA-damage-inducible protein D